MGTKPRSVSWCLILKDFNTNYIFISIVIKWAHLGNALIGNNMQLESVIGWQCLPSQLQVFKRESAWRCIPGHSSKVCAVCLKLSLFLFSGFSSASFTFAEKSRTLFLLILLMVSYIIMPFLSFLSKIFSYHEFLKILLLSYPSLRRIHWGLETVNIFHMLDS